MKKTSLVFLCTCFCLLLRLSAVAQESPKKIDTLKIFDVEEQSIIFKFEPDFIDQNEKRRAEIALTRSMIDTLNVSERMRLKLLKDLYKNGVSKRLQKALLAENTYEDIED